MNYASYVLTATGILIAVLSLWAQLWYRYADYGKKADGNEPDHSIQVTTTLGIIWIYSAILLSFFSFGLLISGTFFGWHTLRFGIGLTISAFIMGLINIAESTFSKLFKVTKGKTFSESLLEIGKNQNIQAMLWVILLMLLFIALLCLFSILAVFFTPLWLVGDLVLILIGLTLYLLFIVFKESSK